MKQELGAVGWTVSRAAAGSAPVAKSAGSGAGAHLDALDGLRGAALLLVVCHHIAYVYPPQVFLRDGVALHAVRFVLRNGWLGVDVFFALSGFLLTGILLRSRGAGNYLSVFYRRRALRIAPVYYGVLVFVFLLPWAGVSHPGWPTQMWWWTNCSNVVSAFSPARWSTVSLFWSLAVEEQFYLLWPFVVRKLSERRLVALALLLVAGEMGLRILPPVLRLTHRYPEVIYRWTPLHCDGLLLGSVVAVAVAKGVLGRRALPLLRAGAVAFTLGTVVLLHAGARFYATPAIAAATSCFIAMLAIQKGQGACSRVLANPAMRRVGRYSYCMYATHTLVLTYAAAHILPRVHMRAGGVRMAGTYAVPLVLTFGVGAVSWALVEGPIHGLRRHIQYRFGQVTAVGQAHQAAGETESTTLAA